jgi:hypothetical protein
MLLLLYPKPEATVTNRARAITTATVFIVLGIVINIMPSYPTTYSLIVYFADVCIYIHDHLGFCLGFVDTLNSVSPEKTLFLSARIPSILHIEYIPTAYMEADINKSKFCYHNIVIFVIKKNHNNMFNRRSGGWGSNSRFNGGWNQYGKLSYSPALQSLFVFTYIPRIEI